MRFPYERDWDCHLGVSRFESQTTGPQTNKLPLVPLGSLYGIFTYIWLIFLVNVVDNQPDECSPPMNQWQKRAVHCLEVPPGTSTMRRAQLDGMFNLRWKVGERLGVGVGFCWRSWVGNLSWLAFSLFGFGSFRVFLNVRFIDQKKQTPNICKSFKIFKIHG